MYSPYREETGVKINIPWDKNTSNGFFISLGIFLVFVALFSTVITIDTTSTRRDVEVIRIPIEIMNFGDGDGTGISKGNLAEEGAAHKGVLPQSNLADASIKANTQASTSNLTNPEDAVKFTPIAEMPGESTQKGEANGTGSKNVGSPNGSIFGTGLGNQGSGPGLGHGLGDIEWGGGGNRMVINKRIPDFPNGARAGQVRIRFTVSKDGTVISMRPAVKGGDPTLEKAAMQALRYWRFNPHKQGLEQDAIITFTFNLR